MKLKPDIDPDSTYALLELYKELVELDPENTTYATTLGKLQEGWAREVRRSEMAAKWSYSSSTDDMTGGTSRYARISSENTVEFDFPYEGTQRARLTLRTHPSYGRDVMFSIERGQLMCPSYDGCTVRVRFDDGAPQSWSASPASSRNSTLIFINGHDRFVERLRRAQIVRIQPRVYQEGNPIFEFEVGGFDNAKYRGR